MHESPNTTLKLSSKIVCAPSFERLAQTKVSRCLLAHMIPLIKKDPEAVGVFDIEILRQSLNYRADSHLQAAIKDLEKYVIDWEDVVSSTVKWGTTYLFERCELDYRGDVHVKINPDLVNEIAAPYSYKILDLKTLLAFRSHYAMRIYEFCNQYFISKENYGRTPNIQPGALRTLLGCGEREYPRAYDFIKYAVTEPLKEIRELTQLNIYLRHDKRHVYSRRYWFEISNITLPGDPTEESRSPYKEYTYLIQRLAAFATKYGNVPKPLFDQTIKTLDEAMQLE